MQEIIVNEPVGGWFALGSAIITIGFGLICLLAPKTAFRILRLRIGENVPQALSTSRAEMAGFYFGASILAIIFNQPLLWLVLGLSWAFAVFGRLVSVIFDDGNKRYNWIAVCVEAALAAGPLIYGYTGLF